MAEFTPLSEWQHLQDTRSANEIVQAYNERRQCVDSSFDPVALLGAGSNAQDTAFWMGIQTWITEQVSRTSGDNRWLNYTVTIEGESAIPFMTLVDFKSLTGLNEGDDTGENATVGWRRATTWPNDWTDYTDPAYSYGPIQSGDIRGPWIFEDLQKGLDALRWNMATFAFPENTEIKLASGTGSDLSEALDDLSTNWSSATWEPGSDAFLSYFASLRVGVNSADAERYRATITYSTPDHIAHEAEHYWLLDKGGGDFYNDVDLPDQELIMRDTFGLEITNERMVPFHDFDAVPIPSDPALVGTFTTYQSSNFVNDYLVLKWEFSHTL